MGNSIGFAVQRVALTQARPDVMPLPNLVSVQLDSYENFLQLKQIEASGPLKLQGFEQVFRSSFPIESPAGDMRLEYERYIVDRNEVKLSEAECKQKGYTYSIPIKVLLNLVFLETGEIRQKEIYFGDIPLMTDRGTFIINGAERVVVSQIHRSPGVIFSSEKELYESRIIPYRGSWLEFEIDSKRDLIYAKIDRKKRILGTMFLRALGFDSREKIIDLFYRSTRMTVSAVHRTKEKLVGQALARAVEVTDAETGEQRVLFAAGLRLHPHDVDELIHSGIKRVQVIDFEHDESLGSDMILNCFEREETKHTEEGQRGDEPSRERAIVVVYSAVMSGEPISIESAERDIRSLFFMPRRYDLGRVGRYKLNKKFEYDNPTEEHVLTPEDIANTMRHLIRVYSGEASVDDIDHLGNRRVRSVGELLANHLKIAFARMERVIKERMSLKDTDTIKPQDIISIKPIVSAIKDFFGSSQLSQFMDQVNPLSELTHKRRLNALGPGGLSRERAGFEVRDVHYSHYGRMCPIETPEGPNIGLIVSLANYAQINDYGFLEAPYRKVRDSKVTGEIEYLSAMDEEKHYIAQANARIGDDGAFLSPFVSVRKSGDYTTCRPQDIQYMDVSPKQIISVSASLIPFLEHDDANRALMGSNMQRQAVPLIFCDPPRVGTGMEAKIAYDSGVLVKAERAGLIEYVSAERIVVRPDGSTDPYERDVYELAKYQRANQDTCYNQKPIARLGQQVEHGDIIADGPATLNGELALGRNVFVGFVPWNGYNFEDAILISEAVVRDDYFTSIHIMEFIIEVRETKLGTEKITRDIPNSTEKSLAQLDEDGIIRLGAYVNSYSILVGKVTPKAETETTPEFKLLNSIFGEKAKEVRDTSLRVPHGIEGVVVNVQCMSRADGDDLSPGVEQSIKVLIATKRKLREGDKMAGRHGNKGVVARVLPVEDMPYTADGTPLDVCLNPLGVPSRMNLGQILETTLGMGRP